MRNFRLLRNRLTIFLTGLLALQFPHVGEAAPIVREVTVGAMAELSGPSAANGEQCKKGYNLAEAIILKNRPDSAVPIRVAYGDNRGEAQAGLSEFKRLIDVEHAVAVVTTRSQVAMPLNPISRQRGIPLVATIGHPDFIKENPLSFRVWPSASQVGQFTAHWLRELGKRRIAILSVQDEFTLSLSRILSETFSAQGGRVVYNEEVVQSESDFSSLVAKLRATDPDVIFVNLSLSQIGSMIRRIREQGIPTLVATNTWAPYPEVIKSAGEKSIEGTLFVDFDFAKPSFLDLAKSISPENTPVAVTYSCYLGLATLLTVAVEANRPLSPSEFRNRLISHTKLSLPDGEIEYQNREAKLRLVKRIFRHGKSEQFEENTSVSE